MFLLYAESMSIRKIIVGSCIFALLLIIGSMASVLIPYHTGNTSQHIDFMYPATLGSAHIMVGIASTEATRKKGLTGQEQLAEDHGLYFLFGKSDVWSIWMKGMKIPIDVLWFDASGSVVAIKSNFQPSFFPHIAVPRSLSSSVLEVSAGFATQHKISLGDKIIFPKKEL